MTLGDLWRALAAGDVAVLDAAYLHRAHRERGSRYFKGREAIAADWAAVLGMDRDCEVLADLGDAALVRVGARRWHHWVGREDGRISREVLVEGGEAVALDGEELVVEREANEGNVRAGLAHRFIVAADGSPLRQVVSRFELEASTVMAVSEALANG